MSVVSTYAVTGMSCGGCANRVRSVLESAALGASTIEVDHQAGQVRITSDAPVAEEAVRAAIATTQYQFAGVVS